MLSTFMSPAFFWPFRAARVGLAFSERFLLALRAGAPPGEVRRRDLPPGLLAPAVVTPNIPSVREVARLASELIDELHARRATVAVLLPDLTLVTAVVPSSDRRQNGDARAALAARLGFPASEARSDFWRGSKGEVLGAAVREAVVRQYEQVVEAADCALGWVDGASLVRIPGWAEASAPAAELTVRVQLYSSHYVLAVFRAGELVDLRTRLRSGDDVAGPAEEVLRLRTLYGVSSLSSVTFHGADASRCAREVGSDGGLGTIAAREEGEEGQLVSALAVLLQRG
jgi:hypothetical protein